MMSVLRRVGVGDMFLKLVSVLYTSPTACVGVNGLVSEPIAVEQGTQQGCALSPLLYALFAEPHLRALREYHAHSGIRFPQYQLIVSAYADDALLYIRDPERNIAPVIQEVIHFRSHSGLCVN